MKNKLTVTARINNSELLIEMVEKLAFRPNKISFDTATIEGNWVRDETSSLEKYVEGEVYLESATETFRVPFITSYLFSCAKINKVYSMKWAMSMN